MAPPNSETVTLTPFSNPTLKTFSNSQRVSQENLKRSISDIAYALSKGTDTELAEDSNPLPAISEAEDAKCECCGMSEEYTAEYIKCVRDKFFGKLICGLCTEAVKGETEKNGGQCKEALETHMNNCVRFNQHGRAYPVLCQAEAMKEMMKKSSKVRAKSMTSSRAETKGMKMGSAIARSSSCISSIMNSLTIHD